MVAALQCRGWTEEATLLNKVAPRLRCDFLLGLLRDLFLLAFSITEIKIPLLAQKAREKWGTHRA